MFGLPLETFTVPIGLGLGPIGLGLGPVWTAAGHSRSDRASKQEVYTSSTLSS